MYVIISLTEQHAIESSNIGLVSFFVHQSVKLVLIWVNESVNGSLHINAYKSVTWERNITDLGIVTSQNQVNPQRHIEVTGR